MEIFRLLAAGAGRISAVNLLGHSGPLPWRQTDEGLNATMPEQKPCEHVFTLKTDVFAILVTYSCSPGAEGSEYLVEVGTEKLNGTSKSTGSWATYTTSVLGKLKLEKPGTLTSSVKPKTDKVPWKAIGLKSIILTPDEK